jgi:hypothetical protein
MRHRIKHHADRPVLHMKLFTDGQMLPSAGLVTLAAGWLSVGGGGLMARTLVACLMLAPVAVMVIDNRLGGLVVQRVAAFVAWHRQAGIFAPGAGEGAGYELRIDEQDQVVLERERMAHVDLEAVFARDS